MYSVVLFGFIVHIKYFKLRIFSLYVDLKLIYFVFGYFDWFFGEAIVMRMTMGDRIIYPTGYCKPVYSIRGDKLIHPPDSLRTDTLFRDTGTSSFPLRPLNHSHRARTRLQHPGPH